VYKDAKLQLEANLLLRAFLFQLIPIVIALVLVEWRLKEPKKDLGNESHTQKLKRVDFAGAITLTLTILATLFVLDMGIQKYGFHSPIVLWSIVVAIVSAIAFVIIEKRAAEPIFPLSLLSHFVVITSYSVLGLQIIAQMAVSSFTLLYNHH
jgi:hypothetical protein